MKYLQRIVNRMNHLDHADKEFMHPIMKSFSPLAEYDRRAELLGFDEFNPAMPNNAVVSVDSPNEQMPVSQGRINPSETSSVPSIQKKSIQAVPSPLPQSESPSAEITQLDTFSIPKNTIFSSYPQIDEFQFIPMKNRGSIESMDMSELDSVREPVNHHPDFDLPTPFFPQENSPSISDDFDVPKDHSLPIETDATSLYFTPTFSESDDVSDNREVEDAYSEQELSFLHPAKQEDHNRERDSEQENWQKIFFNNVKKSDQVHESKSIFDVPDIPTPEISHSPPKVIIENIQVDIIRMPETKQNTKQPSVITAEAVSVIGPLRKNINTRKALWLKYL